MPDNRLQKDSSIIEKEDDLSEKQLNYLIQSLVTTKPTTSKAKNKWKNLLFLAILVIFGIVAIVAFEEFVQRNSDGTYVLKSKRKQKLERDIQRLEEAEQYVLKAAANGYYTCYNCLNTDSIFLFAGNVWRYGTTIDPLTRYKYVFLERNQLTYTQQFVGPLHKCLQEEKRKIVYYPLLPENTNRIMKISRPPGNKVDK